MATELLGKKVVGQKTTVEDTATAIPGTATTGRQAVLIQNLGPEVVWIGASNVTAGDGGTGYKLVVGGELPLDAADACAIYGITESGSSTVKTLEGV